MKIRKLAIAWFDPATYDEVRAMMDDPDAMLATFEEWEQEIYGRISRRGLSLDSLEKVIIDPKDFADFCRVAGVKRDADGRAAYAAAVVAKRYEDSGE